MTKKKMRTRMMWKMEMMMKPRILSKVQVRMGITWVTRRKVPLKAMWVEVA